MASLTSTDLAICAISTASIAGVIARPFRLPEATWTTVGALLVLLLGLMPLSLAWAALVSGIDVYLFLVGMLLLAEYARREGLFDWLAGFAAQHARGSQHRLFALTYAVGIVVTVFLSNDATAVVLTPAVFATARAVRATPLPYVLVCAFIANAASFVLPISNPANLVVFGPSMPVLTSWLARFGWPSMVAIAMTYGSLWLTQRHALRGSIGLAIEQSSISLGGRIALGGIVLMAVALLLASAGGRELGLPTCVAGTLCAAAIVAVKRESPWPALRTISWSVLPLVASLFVLVFAVRSTGILDAVLPLLQRPSAASASSTSFVAGTLVAIVCNGMNNLPLGLFLGSIANGTRLPDVVVNALLIGVDLGPNLSVTGSLATILWLVVLRREGVEVSGWQFLRLGFVVMFPALLMALIVNVLVAWMAS
ncbi:MAG: arsenic transporter [Burkholderiaceae bacterium]